MLFESAGKVYPMDGCERVKAFVAMKKTCTAQDFSDFLEWLYRVHSPRSAVSRSVSYSERGEYVIRNWDLFKGKKQPFDPMGMVGALQLMEFFFESILTEDERTLMVYKEKLDNYRRNLRKKDSTLSEDKEAKEGIDLFSELVLKLEARIREHYADKDSYSGIYGEYLFEIPDKLNNYIIDAIVHKN